MIYSLLYCAYTLIGLSKFFVPFTTTIDFFNERKIEWVLATYNNHKARD